MLGSSPTDKAIRKRIKEKSSDDSIPTTSLTKGARVGKGSKGARNVNAKWEWGPEQVRAYDTLRSALIHAPILAHPDYAKPFIIDTDASQYALGAVSHSSMMKDRKLP